jgi:hypothetical protein
MASALYTEHLSWCGDDSHLYELLPIPFSEDAVRWTAGRIRQAQDILGRRIGIENASYYIAPPGAEMSETEFIAAIVAEADCLLHLDVNNIYVNSCNFGFDPLSFLHALPLERTCYVHVAGHYVEPDGLLIDTHGAAVIDPVWTLLAAAYERIGGGVPTCLERDFNIPDLAQLTAEVGHIARLQAAAPQRSKAGGMMQPPSRSSSAPLPATSAIRITLPVRLGCRNGKPRFIASSSSTTCAALSIAAFRCVAACLARRAGVACAGPSSATGPCIRRGSARSRANSSAIWPRRAIAQPLPAWFADLAHYEWAELAMDISDAPLPAFDPAGDLMARPVVLNPALMHLACAWPVQRIGPDYKPRKPQPTQLLVYRTG